MTWSIIFRMVRSTHQKHRLYNLIEIARDHSWVKCIRDICAKTAAHGKVGQCGLGRTCMRKERTTRLISKRYSMPQKRKSLSRRDLLETQLSTLAALVKDLSPKARVEISHAQYEDED